MSIIRMILTAFFIMVATSHFANGNNERFALHGRAAPENFAALQTGHDVGQVRSGGKELVSSRSPSYPASIGGDKSYEYISSFTVTPKDGYYKITVKVICPKLYDEEGYPGYGDTYEYVNVWIDWNGDYSWSDSECVMAKSSANYKKILADNKILYFETTVKDASAAGGTFKARAMLGYGYNPTNPATYSWTWGDVMDKSVSFSIEPPEVVAIAVGPYADVAASGLSSSKGAVVGVNKNINGNNAIVLGRKNNISVGIKVKKADREKPGFNYKAIVIVNDQRLGPLELSSTPYATEKEYGYYYLKGQLEYPSPEEIPTTPGSYGKKTITVQLDCTDPSVDMCSVPQSYDYYVFYPAKHEKKVMQTFHVENDKGGYNKITEKVSMPMWFIMWREFIDELKQFEYHASIDGGSSLGQCAPSLTYEAYDKIDLDGTTKEGDVSWNFFYRISKAAWEETQPAITLSSKFTQSKVDYEIDEVYRTVKHELEHGKVNRDNNRYQAFKLNDEPGNEWVFGFLGDDEMKLEQSPSGKWKYKEGDLLSSKREKEISSLDSLTDTYSISSKKGWGRYKSYGDQEYYVRWIADEKGSAKKQRASEYYSQDWSFPGSQLREEQLGISSKASLESKVKSKVLTASPISGAEYSSRSLSGSLASFVMNNDNQFQSGYAPEIAFLSTEDATGDFTTEGLSLETRIDHLMDGVYTLNAYLFGTNGIPVAMATTTMDFDNSTKVVRFEFAADIIGSAKEYYEGPYVLGRISCEVIDNPMAITYSEKYVFTTKDYSAYECKVTKPIVGSKMSDYADGEGLHVVIPVTVPSTGTYVISAYLATTNGMNLVNATTNCVCAEGKNSIDVCFPKDGVFNTKMSGRFLVRDVSVTPEGGEPSLFVCDYETESYDYSDFDSGERTIVIQPDTIALSVSEDTDDPYGLYKGLAVRFAVDNANSADYSLYRVSAILADANGYDVAYAAEDFILNGQSTQTLFFPAQDIRESEKDGPYTVKNIRITDRQTGDLIDACVVSGVKTVDLSSTDFKSKLTAAEDAISVTPVPAGNGVYSGLKLAVPVDAPSAGYVTLSACVDDNEGRSVGRFENDFEVQSGYNQLELVMDGARFREAELDGPYKIKSIEVKHSASPENPYVVERTFETGNYKYTQFAGQDESLWQIGFGESQSVVEEGANVIARIAGGSADAASSVKMYLSYQTAAAADLDLARGTIDGVTPKGGLKFPLSLGWEAGETGEKVVTIPVKPDKTVEADEIFTLQLADAQGMELSGERVYTVTIADPGYAALAAKVADGTATRAEQTQWSKLQRSGYYVRALADTADGGKVTGSGFCAEGRKVTLKATANKNFTFIGWSDTSGEVVAATATLAIDRSAKPAANTKTSTTLTGISGDATYYAMFKSDPSVIVEVCVTDGTGAEPTGKGAGKYVAGTIAGEGKYAPGKKVTLKATANSGYVFSSWQWCDDETATYCNRYSQEPSLSFTMMDSDVPVLAEFVTAEQDAEYGIGLLLGDEWAEDGLLADSVLRCGITVNWPIGLDALSAATVKVAGLPAGLKLVQDKDTKEYRVEGVPTAVSKTNAKTGEVVPSIIKFTITTAGKTTRTFSKNVVVKPLPQWAYGTFNGSIGRQLGADDDYRFDGQGTISMTVSASGKISGKVVMDGTNYTFSANGYSEWSYVEGDDSDAYLMVDVEAKSGKATIPVVLHGYRENRWLSEAKENVANCVFRGSGEDCGGHDVELSRDLWKDADNAAALSAWAGTYTYVTADGDVLALAVDEKGAVKVSGTLGAKRKVSASAPLHPYLIDVYIAPTKTDGAFFERVYLANWHKEATAGEGVAYRDAGVVLDTESLDGTGTGTVTANPKYGQVAGGKAVTLTAKAAKDSVFVKWVYESEDGDEIFEYAPTFRLVAPGHDVHVRAVFAAKENIMPPEPYVDDWESWKSATAGVYFTSAVFVDDMARPVSFSAKNLPAGLKIDKTTGVISGTPTKAFDGVIIVSATSLLDGKMSGSFEIPVRVYDSMSNE